MRRVARASNYFLELAKELGTKDRVVLDEVGYDGSKRAHRLGGCLVQAACTKAAEAYDSHREIGGGWPRLRGTALRLRSDTFGIYRGRGGWTLWVLTVGGRVHMPIVARGPQWAEIERELAAGNVKGGELVRRGDEYRLHVFIKKDAVLMPVAEAEHVVAIDRGVVNLATLTVTDGAGKVRETRVVPGGRAGWKRRQGNTVRRSLQKARRRAMVRRLRGREERYMRDLDHKLAREIVRVAERYPKTVVALEDLRSIRRKRQATPRGQRRLHNWSFGRLGDFIEYKARALGIPVLTLRAANTTRYCGRCGTSNTVRDRTYRCRACRYVVDRDVNGARNIAKRAWRYIRKAAGRAEPTAERESGPRLKEGVEAGC